MNENNKNIKIDTSEKNINKNIALGLIYKPISMILGVPIVTSDVGGIMSMITHEREGFVCQYNAPYMFAHYIMRIFEEGEKASAYGVKAREHARSTHDGQKNYDALLRIYREISLIRNEKKIGE